MKVSNFKLIEVIREESHGIHINSRFRAHIDVTERRWLKKETKEREIYSANGGSWYFSDTGIYTPNQDVERLVKSLEARQGKPLKECAPSKL